MLLNDMEYLAGSDEPAPDVPHATAYLLEYLKGSYLAFATHTGVELVEQPRIVAVPGSPHFCLGLMPWQGRQLPLVDLARFILGPIVPDTPAIGHVLVLAYQKARFQALEYGAVCAPSLISKVEVVDSQQCDLPETGNRS